MLCNAYDDMSSFSSSQNTRGVTRRSGASRPVHTDSMKHEASESDVTSQATGLPRSNPVSRLPNLNLDLF